MVRGIILSDKKRERPGTGPMRKADVFGIVPGVASAGKMGTPLREDVRICYNRGPSSDLAPWIGRLYAAVFPFPPDQVTTCGLFNDCTTIRLQMTGRFAVETPAGLMEFGDSAMVYGPNAAMRKVTATGSYILCGVALRPGCGHALLGIDGSDMVDRIVSADSLGLPGRATIAALEAMEDPEAWFQYIEGVFRQFVDRARGKRPDPVAARFEALAFTDPSANIAEFADGCGVSQRQMERIIARDFGLPPRQVLRRARALDMAAWLLGVADQAEAEALALRYYDQSHLIREFAALFGCSPTQLAATPRPMLTLALEARQAKRLEFMKRLAPGAVRPWE